MSSSTKINSVFYADSYHPIQAGSIDGTDILPHDNAVYRALLCSSAGLYDPLGDPKVIGDPYRTVFVGRLSDQTDEESLRKAMSKYGRVKNLRLVRHIVTGASRGYAFVEYETDREMRRAYEDAHHSVIDDNEVIVDYSRQQLMAGWIPRRLGGGLGGKKESGQLRFGGRERPFRAPLRPIPYDDLKRLGIPPPPEGQYMTRFEVPSPPRRSSSLMSGEGSPLRERRSQERRSVRTSREHSPSRERRSGDKRSSHTIRGDSPSRHRSEDRRSAHTSREHSPLTQKRSEDRRSKHRTRDDSSSRHSRYEDREEPSTWGSANLSKEETTSRHRRFDDIGEDRQRHRRSPVDRNESLHKQDRHEHEHSYKHKKRSSTRVSSPRRRKRSSSRE